MPVELYLARRYLLDRRHGAWGWIISLIATGSVALGVAALIVTLAVMTGFRNDIQEKMLGVQPHILISSFTGKISPIDMDIETSLKDFKDVESWAPFVTGQILIGRGKQSAGATIKGIRPNEELKVANLKTRLVSGDWNDLTQSQKINSQSKPKIILGQELARNIGARVGDIIWIVTPNSIGITALSIPRAHLFEVSGVLRTGLYDYDSVLAYINIDSAKNLFGLNQNISGYGLRLKRDVDLDAAAREIQNTLVGAYWVRSWLSQNKPLFSALKLERVVMFIILAMLTVVAAFMIVSNLLLTITQKIKEIGILRAMGATQQTIRKTFLYQGLLMGVVGNGLGVVLGLGVAKILGATNFIRLPADVYYIDHLPVHLVPMDIISVVLLSLFIVLIATVYPATKAARLDPLDAIRYG